MRMRLMILILALLVCGSSGGNTTAAAPRTGVTADNPASTVVRTQHRAVANAQATLPITGRAVPELSAFDDAMLAYMAARSIEAGLLAVMKDGVVVLERGYGWQDEAHTTPLPPDALMRIASVTKPITNAAIQTLMAAGELSPDDKVFCLGGTPSACWLTIAPFGTPDSRLQDVTVQHLLDHRGGWDRDISGDPMFRAIEIANALGVPSPPTQQQIVAYMMGRPLDHTPGTVYAYSNFGYLLLGLIVEEATGQNYTTYVQNELFAPLGVLSTEVELGRVLPENRNPREPWYDSPGTGPSIFPPHNPVPWPDGAWHLEAMEAHGGLISTTRALLAFADAYWFTGLPRSGNGQDWVSFGSLDGTFSMLRWRPDGINIAVMVNSRDFGPNHEDIWPQLDAVAESIETWPEPAIAPALSAAPVADGVQLSWSGGTGASIEIHGSDTPDFTPTADTLLTALSGTSGTYLETSVASSGSAFYVARMINAAATVTDDSDRVGYIRYPLNNSGDTYSMLAVPFATPSILDAADLAAHIGDVAALLKWNAATQAFRLFVPPASGDNFSVSAGDAVMVQLDSGGPTGVALTGDVVSVHHTLVPNGYNFLSLPLQRGDLTDAAAVAADMGNVETLLRWDESTQAFRFFAPPSTGDNFELTPGAPFSVATDGSDVPIWP